MLEIYAEGPDGGIGERVEFGALPGEYGLDFLKNEVAAPPPITYRLDQVSDDDIASSSPMKGLYEQIKKNKNRA